MDQREYMQSAFAQKIQKVGIFYILYKNMDCYVFSWKIIFRLGSCSPQHVPRQKNHVVATIGVRNSDIPPKSTN
jgi:hypothetical protein